MNRQLMILLIGRILTNFADSFYMMATIWYVKSSTNSPLLIGITSAVAILPITLQFIFGPLIDRYPKKKILYISMFGQAVMVSIIALLYFSNLLWLPLLFLLMFLALSLSECTYPTESALIEGLTTRDNLTKVNSIFAFSYQSLNIICNAVSGLLIVFMGLGVIYLSNSLILLITGMMFLFYLKVPKTQKETEKTNKGFVKQYKEDFVQGFYVVKEQKVLLSIVLGAVGMNVLATMGIAVLPVISTNSAEYGFWLTAMSIGTLVGTGLSSKVTSLPLNKVMPFSALSSGVLWMLSITFLDHDFYSYILFGLSWIGIGILSIYIQTLIQVNLPREFLGIGFSFISSLLGSLTPFGYFIGGLIAELTSGPILFFISGTGYFGFVVYFLLHPKLKKLNNRLDVRFDQAA